MGMGFARFAMGAALLAVAGCKPAAIVPEDNQAANITAPEAAPAPVATSAAVAASPLARWLVGSWSYDDSCATDFMMHFNADGGLQNGEDAGRWSLDGDAVTETITERFAMGSDAPEKLSPPEMRSYTVVQIDAEKGSITFRGKKIPIQRC